MDHEPRVTLDTSGHAGIVDTPRSKLRRSRSDCDDASTASTMSSSDERVDVSQAAAHFADSGTEPTPAEAPEEPDESLKSLKSPTKLKMIQNALENVRSLRRRRRSRSAPPTLRQPILEAHFRLKHDENDKRVLLPGVPAYGDDFARDTHDFFNLIVLIPIVVLNIINWDWEIFMKGTSLQKAWSGDLFEAFFFGTILYFVTDLLWILAVPKCVKSPAIIVQHHVVTMLYMIIPYCRPQYQWVMGACMSVEVNTWFLIARRVFNKQGFPPWVLNLSFVSIRIKIISICFYVTWISLRCVLYPYIMVYLVNLWLDGWTRSGRIINVDIIAPIIHSVFCALNFKWTYDLIMSKVRYFRRSPGKGDDRISKGL